MSADPMLLWAVLTGVLVMGGLVLAVAGARRRVPALGDAVAALDGTRPRVVAGSTREERLGAWADRALRVPIAGPVRRRLALSGRSTSEFLVDKLVYAAIGLITPAVMAGTATVILGWSPVVPVAAGVVGAVVGFFVPDLQALRADKTASADAGEALFTYFDLVTLERLANMSATQAMTSAAELSDIELFVQLRGALDRARLEQRPPYEELTKLAEQLGLPELADIADVMRLDETGAPLSGALRARVRELRDAHLTRERIAAQAVSEHMTIWMTIPSIVFALIFLVPPLLRLLQ